MISNSIRGAITTEENSINAISEATSVLMGKIFEDNLLTDDKISHIIFSITKDLNAINPATVCRENFLLNNTAFMCFNEAEIIGGIAFCIRVLVVLNSKADVKYVYLKNAKNLRSDLG